MQQARELKSFGKYRLIAALGTGGMAKVYLALMAGPAGFNKLLVIKILREDLEHIFTASTESLQMFWKEARLAARLNHPNIVQTHEVGEINGHYFIAMEYLDGQPYTAILSRTRKVPLSIAEHLRIVSGVARALHYSHTLRSYEGGSTGIVHRDVSPHNIVVTYDGQVKLLDFGVATTDDPEHVTRVGVIKGKLDYIAPEQLRGDPIDGRADIFALGAVLWEALSGQRFGGGRRVPDAIKVQTRLVRGERKLRELRPALPEELVNIVECATALDPAERFADAATFADALDAYTVSLGERPTSQSLSAALTPLFEVERVQMTEVINAQLQAQKSASVADELDEETGYLPRIDRDSDEGLVSDVPDAPDEPSVRGGFTRAAASIPSGVDMSRLGMRTDEPRAASVAASAPRGRDLALLVAGTMAAGAVLALLWPRAVPSDTRAGAVVARRATEAPAAAQVEPADPAGAVRAPDSVALRAQAAPELVLLKINVAPLTARLWVDGVPVQAPFSGQFRQDASLHVVEASAEGFRRLKQFVSFERDQTLALALSRSSWSARHGAEASQASSVSSAELGARGQGPRVSAASSQRGQTSTSSEGTPSAQSGKPAQVRSAVPGADIELDGPGTGADDINQVNPYRKQK